LQSTNLTRLLLCCNVLLFAEATTVLFSAFSYSLKRRLIDVWLLAYRHRAFTPALTRS